MQFIGGMVPFLLFIVTQIWFFVMASLNSHFGGLGEAIFIGLTYLGFSVLACFSGIVYGAIRGKWRFALLGLAYAVGPVLVFLAN